MFVHYKLIITNLLLYQSGPVVLKPFSGMYELVV
jgi:hypothetical protein